MNVIPSTPARRRALAAAIVIALANVPAAHAVTVTPGAPLILDNVDASADRYVVDPGAELQLLNGTRVQGVTMSASNLVVQGSTLSGPQALRMSNGSTATITDGTLISTLGDIRGSGMTLTMDGTGFAGASATLLRTSVQGTLYGANINVGAVLDASASTFVATADNSAGIGLFGGSVNLTDGSKVSGQRNGVEMGADARAPIATDRTFVADGSSITGMTDSAILVHQISTAPTTAQITLRNGTTLTGGNGIAIDVRDHSTADVAIASSAIVGDVVTDATASATIGLTDNATLLGAAHGNLAMNVGSGTAWTLRDTSDVASLDLQGGSVALGQAGDAGFHDLVVKGAFSSGNGALVFNTALDEGGPLRGTPTTDRLLIEGDVTTTTPTLVTVRGRGDGAITDTNQNGVVDASEGISLIQVGGSSRADAFQLAGGYVAAGPYQYKLYAFGPGEVDPTQKALAGDGFNWDYRLGNSYVCEKDCEPVNPEEPGNPGEPGEPGGPEEPGPGPGPAPGERAEVVPQVPAYLSAPAALLTYGDMLNDGLHQRLGDIRKGDSGDPVGGELFARYLGGQLRYSSNLAFQRYGYDFDQQVNALQVGAGIIALDGDNGSLRAGWALDHGTTRVTPKAVDGSSNAKYTANGGSAWVTWQHGNGLWVDGVVSATRYSGNVSTAMRGDEVAKIHATGRILSIEAGMPFALGDTWTLEPQLQVKHQQLTFRDFQDKDGLDVTLGTAKQTTERLGLQLSWSANPVFAPYGRVDFIHSSNGDPGVDVSSEGWDIGSRFQSGRVGNAVRAAAGLTSQLCNHVQLYGEGTWQHFTGSYGMRGWAGYAGIRVTF